MAFSPDSKWLVTGVPGEYRILSVGDWELKLAIPKPNPGGLVSPAEFSPDSKLLALCPTRTSVRLVDPESGVETASFSAPGLTNVASVAFHPDGGALYVTDAAGRLHIWNLRLIRRRLADLGLDWGESDLP